ncbi:MAG: hypothetical protein V1733_11700 [bacterium]
MIKVFTILACVFCVLFSPSCKKENSTIPLPDGFYPGRIYTKTGCLNEPCSSQGIRTYYYDNIGRISRVTNQPFPSEKTEITSSGECQYFDSLIINTSYDSNHHAYAIDSIFLNEQGWMRKNIVTVYVQNPQPDTAKIIMNYFYSPDGFLIYMEDSGHPDDRWCKSFVESGGNIISDTVKRIHDFKDTLVFYTIYDYFYDSLNTLTPDVEGILYKGKPNRNLLKSKKTYEGTYGQQIEQQNYEYILDPAGRVITYIWDYDPNGYGPIQLSYDCAYY